MPIEALRGEVSRIDREIIRLIAKRQQVANQIARVKHKEGLPIHDETRTKEVLDYAFEYAVEQKINPVSVQEIFSILIQMSEERQRERMGDGNLP